MSTLGGVQDTVRILRDVDTARRLVDVSTHVIRSIAEWRWISALRRPSEWTARIWREERLGRVFLRSHSGARRAPSGWAYMLRGHARKGQHVVTVGALVDNACMFHVKHAAIGAPRDAVAEGGAWLVLSTSRV